jgi:hypothetical protein
VGLFDVIVTNDESSKSASSVFLVSDDWDKDRFVGICLGTKFETLGTDIISPDGKDPVAYVVTIEGVKVVPTAWELNAARIPASVI